MKVSTSYATHSSLWLAVVVSLNRHAVATLADVGIPKVQCLQRRLIAIAPWVKFDLKQEQFNEEVAERLLQPWSKDGRAPDYVIDAIDNIETKVALLEYCHKNDLPVISAMGAGCKSDPTKIIVGDIGSSKDDGLSRATRRRLKLKGITSGIPVVYSTETSGAGKAELLPLPEEEFEKGSVGDLAAMPNFRVRILPVLGTMPAIFGLTVANHVILSITGYPIDYVPAKGRDRMYDGILTTLQGYEDKLAKMTHKGDTVGLKVPVTVGDVAFLTEELYSGRSAISGSPHKVGPRAVAATFWKQHDDLGRGQGHSEVLYCKALKEVYDAATIARVEEKRKEAEKYEVFR
ncbi:hypothetical protein NM208_g10381 [Fusarium decemcellulare]|uniref:Uncharacterized protein n=1 Tax=Fusarium decemcellulare TaxID=57161 RepID=A0ACC1RYA2_9HYPO|nr:hypothetical protein NM208_g10381 [Fusarium decemcellulare]